MNEQGRSLEEALSETLQDRRLSRSERRALREVLEEAAPDRAQRDLLRAHAFELVADSLSDARDREALGWLRDTVGLLLRATDGEGPAGCAAAFSPGEDCRRMICTEIDAARRSVDVCVFTLTDDRITAALAAAHKRGVRLRVLSDDDKSEDLGSDVEILAGLGVPVAYDRGPDHMHHKFAIFDRRRLLTGSYNWTRSAFRANHENVLSTDDARLIRSFEAEFERLWAQYAAPEGTGG